MSVYKIKDLLSDCAKKRGRLNVAPKDRLEVLENVWESLNAWIMSRFDVGKSAHVANFARIGWEMVTVGRNIKKKRPAFVLDESYAKAYGISRKSKFVPPEFLSMEEINFTKIAIKFSKNLVKDTVFSGLRDILQRLGEVIGTGRQVSIQFSMGKLIARERAVHMLFDPEMFPATLNYIATPSILGAPSVFGDLDDYELPDTSEVPAANLAHIDEEEEDLARLYEESAFTTAEEQQPASNETTPATRPLSPLAKAGGGIAKLALEYKGDEAPPEAHSGLSDRDAVLEEAYKRHVEALEKDIEQDLLDALEVHKKHFEDCRIAYSEKTKKKEAATQLQLSIQDQMKKRAVEREHQRKMAPSDFPDAKCTILPLESEYSKLEQTRKKIPGQMDKATLNQHLRNQIDEKTRLSKERRTLALQEEKMQLDSIEQDVSRKREEDLKNLRDKRRYLTAAWKRDNHVKTLIEARKKQLNEQLRHPALAIKLGDAPPDDFSVGFDIRSQQG